MEVRAVSGELKDEIRLSDIIKLLWKKKWLIIFTVVFFYCVAFLYLYSKKPVYEARAYLLSPTAGDIAAFNYGRTKEKNGTIAEFEKKEIDNIFTASIYSEGLKAVFLKNINSLSQSSSQDKIDPSSNTSIFIKTLPNTTPKMYQMVMRGTDRAKLKEWLGQYISVVQKSALDKVINTIHNQNEMLAQNFEYKLKILREVAKQEREDRLLQLNEALNNAQAMDFKNSSDSVSGYVAKENLSSGNSSRIKSLKSKINNLTNRISNDPFTPELRKTQALYYFYKNLKIDTKGIQIFRIDGEVEVIDQPVSPHKAIIYFLAGLFGLLAGMTIALAHGLINKSAL